MPTLQELLAGNDPEQLKLLLNSARKSPAPPELPEAQPSPISKEMLGIDQPNSTVLPDYLRSPASTSLTPEEKEIDNSPNASVQLGSTSPGPGTDTPVPSSAPPIPSQIEQGFTNNTVADLKDVQDTANKDKNLNQLLRSLNMISGGAVGKSYGTAIKANDEYMDSSDKMADDSIAQFKERTAKEADDAGSKYSKEFKAYLEPIMKQLGMNPEIIKDASANQIKELLPFTQKMFDAQENRQMRRDVAKESADARREARSDKKADESSVGQKTLDRLYAKDYNEWTTAGAPAVDKNLQRLKEAKEHLEKEGKSDSGRFVGRLPDVLRSEQSLRTQQDVQAAAQGALKATLGAQFTENEGKRIMNMAYDPTLSPKENIRKIDMAIKEIEDQKTNQNEKAKYFEKNGTLSGLGKASSKSSQPKSSVDDDIQDYANEHFDGDYDRAEAFLKKSGQL